MLELFDGLVATGAVAERHAEHTVATKDRAINLVVMQQLYSFDLIRPCGKSGAAASVDVAICHANEPMRPARRFDLQFARARSTFNARACSSSIRVAGALVSVFQHAF
jgi:hypothetical protein